MFLAFNAPRTYVAQTREAHPARHGFANHPNVDILCPRAARTDVGAILRVDARCWDSHALGSS